MDYIKMATEFVNEVFPDADGALLSGSAVTGDMSPHSDLDILIFYRNVNDHYREVLYYQDQKIEAMVHRVAECYQMFKTDQRKRNKSFLDLVCKGKIIKDTDDVVKNLCDEALAVYKETPPAFTPFEKNLYHYILSNRLEDFRDAEDRHEAYFIFNNLLHFLTKYMLISKGHWTNKGDGKWQLRSIMEHDPNRGRELLDAMDDFTIGDNKTKIVDIVQEVLLELNPDPKYQYKAGIPPSDNMNRRWCMIDVYYADSHEALLVAAVKPFIKDLKEKFAVETAFFTRSFKNGSHISVYLVTDEEQFNKEIIPYTDEALGTYLSMNPSLRFIPDMYKRLSKRYQLFENNSIQYHTFDVDPIKFMGVHGLRVLEKQFDASTNFVLDTLELNPETNYNDKMGVLLKVCWAVLYSLGLSIDEIGLFFRVYWDSWGTYQFLTAIPPIVFHDKVTNDIPLPPKIEHVKELSFKKRFDGQKDQMIKFITKFSEDLEGSQSSLDETLQCFLSKLKETNIELVKWRDQGKVYLPDPVYDERYKVSILDQHPLWFFYKEIIHGLFNRFGVVHENEAYVVYLIKELVSALSNSPVNEPELLDDAVVVRD